MDGATLGVWEASAAEGIAVPQVRLPPGYALVRGDDAEDGLRIDARGELGVWLLP